MRLPSLFVFAVAVSFALVPVTAPTAWSAELYVGAATADITPSGAAPLTGHTNIRFSQRVHSPLKAVVLALESREGDKVIDQAILIACDLCVIRPGVQDGLRKYLGSRLAGFDLDKLVMAGTHTHCSPVLLQDRYMIPGDAVQPRDCLEHIYKQTAEAAEQAWTGRRRATMAFGLGHAVVAQCRRAVYDNGTAQMYGKVDTPSFRGLENHENHGVDCLYFFDQEDKLLAVLAAVWCPAQSQGGAQVSGDFWHDVRELIAAEHGSDACVLGFCGPAGDMSPSVLVNKSAEARMERLHGRTHTQELGYRIARAISDVLPVARKDVHADMPLAHVVKRLDLPTREVPEADYAAAKSEIEALSAKGDAITSVEWRRRDALQYVVDRYDAQQRGEGQYATELHVLRIGDVAIATNPFELFVDYGVQMLGRSPATQTVLIQLAGQVKDHGYYLPTADAIPRGSYSAGIRENAVGPEGGQILVDETVKAMNELFKK